MHQVQNVLYISEPDISLHYSNHAVELLREKELIQRIPLHLLEGIVCFSYRPATPALMEACADAGIGYSVIGSNGRLRYRVVGTTHGNVLLRMKQYTSSLNPKIRVALAALTIGGKLRNALNMLRRFEKNHDTGAFTQIPVAENRIRDLLPRLKTMQNEEEIRGVEGIAAQAYFGAFDELLLVKEPALRFEHRSSNPPENAVNAMLSFAYTLLTNAYVSALETVGLDPYVGFFHGTRPGKPSLALDLMEELRSAVDRFVIRLVNLRVIQSDMFAVSDVGEIRFTDEGRKRFLSEWSAFRKTPVPVYGFDGKVELSLVPFLQAQQLAKFFLEEMPYSPWIMEE